MTRRPFRITCALVLSAALAWLALPSATSADVALQSSQAESGVALYHLVRDLLSGGWFVEGSYD